MIKRGTIFHSQYFRLHMYVSSIATKNKQMSNLQTNNVAIVIFNDNVTIGNPLLELPLIPVKERVL